LQQFPFKLALRLKNQSQKKVTFSGRNLNISGMASKQSFYCIVFSSVPWKLRKRGRNLCCWPEFNNMLVKVLEKLLPFAKYVLADQCYLVARPYYSARPVCFRSRGPSEFSFGRSSRIRHRNILTEKAWEDAVQGPVNDQRTRLRPSKMVATFSQHSWLES